MYWQNVSTMACYMVANNNKTYEDAITLINRFYDGVTDPINADTVDAMFYEQLSTEQVSNMAEAVVKQYKIKTKIWTT